MDGFFRILQKVLSELICTRLYIKFSQKQFTFLKTGRPREVNPQDFGLAWILKNITWWQQRRHVGDVAATLAVLSAKVWQCTVVNSVLEIWLEILGDFMTKIFYFIRKNLAGNGPLVFCTVLCLNLCQKLVFSERNG